jgi:hypothetical protein
MSDISTMQLNFRKVPEDPNLFEFTITSAMLRCQFRVPREVINKLRVDLERALLN